MADVAGEADVEAETAEVEAREDAGVDDVEREWVRADKEVEEWCDDGTGGAEAERGAAVAEAVVVCVVVVGGVVGEADVEAPSEARGEPDAVESEEACEGIAQEEEDVVERDGDVDRDDDDEEAVMEHAEELDEDVDGVEDEDRDELALLPLV